MEFSRKFNQIWESGRLAMKQLYNFKQIQMQILDKYNSNWRWIYLSISNKYKYIINEIAKIYLSEIKQLIICW